MSGDCPPGWGAKRGKRGSKADGGRDRTVRAEPVRPPRTGGGDGQLSYFYFILNHALLSPSRHRLISLTISNLSTLPSSLPSFFLPCAESPPSSRRGSQTSLTVVTLPTISHPRPHVQVPPPIRPSAASHLESLLVVSLEPSPGLLSQPNDQQGPQHSQSLPTPHRLPRRARSRFAHQRMTVLVI